MAVLSGGAWSIIFALAAGVATIVGGMLVPERLGRKAQAHLIAFGAGYMLAAAFLSMMPESIKVLPTAPMWILVGYVLVHLFEHTFVPHFHFGEETHVEHFLDPRAATSALVGLALHSVFDGVAISAGFLVTPSLGLLIALAIILHKVPEGITVASVMIASGKKRSAGIGAATLLGVATVVGSLAALALSEHRAYALALSSGIAVYVAATDLLPEVNKQHEKEYAWSALGGLLLFVLVRWLSHLIGLDHDHG